MRKGLIIVFVLILFSGCVLQETPSVETPPEQVVKRSEYDLQEALCREFVIEQMLSETGGIRTNFLDVQHQVLLATGHEVLSESQGLMMQYAVDMDDELLFDQIFSFVEESLSRNTIISYRYDPDGQAYHVNAAIDDLRIIGALFSAGHDLDTQYRDHGKDYAKRLYEANVRNGNLYDFYDEEYEVANDFITLCYNDFYIMDQMSLDDGRWRIVRENMLPIVQDGYLGDVFPFYSTSYSYKDNTYSQGDINMVESLLTVYHLARIDEVEPSTLEYLYEMLMGEGVVTHYTQSGKPLTEIHSTAIYALIVLIGCETERDELVEQAMSRMLAYQILDETHRLYGAFGNLQTEEAYSFDNLMALAAFRREASLP